MLTAKQIEAGLAFAKNNFSNDNPLNDAHVSHVAGLPWAQFLPHSFLDKLLRRNNQAIIGDLAAHEPKTYCSINQTEHQSFQRIIQHSHGKISNHKGLWLVFRLSLGRKMNLRFFRLTI